MIRTNQLSVTVLSALLFSTGGCGGLTDQAKPQTTPTAQEQKLPVLLDRYELREIRNQSYFGTALLDRQTGRVWMLDTTSKVGQVATPAFVEVPINPRPEAAAKEAGWLWNPKTGRYEPPKNPY